MTKHATLRIIFCVAALPVAGCQFENEDDCLKRLVDDFEGYAEAAKEMGYDDEELAARGAILTAFAIKLDDNRNICDYVSAGPRLERKR